MKPKLNPQPSTLNPSSAFTLIEILFSIFVLSVITVAAIAILTNLISQSRQQGGALSDSDKARKLSNMIMNELRNAENSNTGAYALDTAGAQSLIFYSNIDGGTDVERLRYYLQNGSIYRGVLKPTGSPLIYNPANEQVTNYASNVANGANPIFYYYNENYSGVTDSYLAQPVTVTAVTLVKLRLDIHKTAGVTNSATYTVYTEGMIRNLKTNLGD